MPPAAVTLPVWFQVTLGVIAILSFLGGAWFALFIIWPSIRKSNRVADRILGGSDLSGRRSSKEEFAQSSPEDQPL